MAWKIIVTIWTLQLTMGPVVAYRILCVFPMPSRSHDILGQGFVKALLQAGHQVTWVTPYPEEKFYHNLTIIDVHETLEFQSGISKIEEARKFANVYQVKEFAKNVSTATIKNKELRATLANDRFDAVVSEWFFSDAYAGMAALQQVPWIMFSSVAMHPYLEYLVDEIRSISILPMMITDFPLPMNFFQRLTTSLMGALLYAESMYNLPESIKLYELYSPLANARRVSLPPFVEALHNISVLFLNSHTSYAPAQSLPPNVVEIGGFHIEERNSSMSKDLQNLLDSSPQGVVYFSMGSVLKSKTLPEEKREKLLQVFGQISQIVLWKFESQIQNLPKNVYIRPWLPQLNILCHPNVKLFISHGGLLSILEAIHCGVPMLVIPIYGDQSANAIRAVEAGFARRLTYSDHLASDLRVAVKEILQNESYYLRAQHLSKLFRNRPVAPSKLISHYVELAIETKGAHHLRSKAQLYPWYQRWLIDQLLLILILTYLLYKLVSLSLLLLLKCVSNRIKLRDNSEKKTN